MATSTSSVIGSFGIFEKEKEKEREMKNDPSGLKGRVAVVTGGGRGIGKAISTIPRIFSHPQTGHA